MSETLSHTKQFRSLALVTVQFRRVVALFLLVTFLSLFIGTSNLKAQSLPEPYYSNLALAVTAQRANFISLEDSLKKIGEIDPIAVDFNEFLRSYPKALQSKRKLQRLYFYFHAMKRFARTASIGMFHHSLRYDAALIHDQNAPRLTATMLSIIEEFDLPAPDIKALAIASFCIRNPNITNETLQYTARQLWLFKLDFSDYANARGVDRLYRRLLSGMFYYPRAMRQVNVQFLIQKAEYPVFDNLGYDKKPNLVERDGLMPVELLTTWYFFPYDDEKRDYYDLDRVHEEIIRERFRSIVERRGTDLLYVVDIEHWDSYSDPYGERFSTLVPETHSKLVRILDILRDEVPGALLCTYMLLPHREVNFAYLGPDADEYKRWQSFNSASAARMLPRVDAICPSLYTVHHEEDRYPAYALANLSEANRLSSGDGVVPSPPVSFHLRLPVFSYMLPRFHSNAGNNPYGDKFIPNSFLRDQFQLVRSYSDGIVLWDGALQWQRSWELPTGWYQVVKEEFFSN